MTCEPASPGTPRRPWSPSWRRYAPGPAAPSATPPASRCASWDGARSSSTASSSASTSSSAPSPPPALPAFSPSTGSAPTPRRCCSSPPGTTQNGCAARPPGRTCAAPPPSRHPQARPSAAGSTLAATARPTTPCGGSCSPAWAQTRLPLPDVAVPRVLGIDDFALRRGLVYATVLIDAETGRRVDVVPGRTTDAAEAWLRDHPGVEVLCGDGSGAYGEA